MHYVSRERMFRLIENSKGRFFGLYYKDSNGNRRLVNAKFINRVSNHRDQDKIFGYTTLYTMPKKRFIRVSNHNLVGGNFNHEAFKVKGA